VPNRGELDIAAAESTLLYLLPQFVKRFSTKYPEIRFRLHNVAGLDGIAMLRADEFDFGIGSMIEIPDDISFRPLFTYAKMLITAREHPLASFAKPTLRDISPHGLILPPRHLNTWRLVKMVFAQHNLECRALFEAGGWEVIKKYVEQNLGVSIVTAICLTGRENLPHAAGSSRPSGESGRASYRRSQTASGSASLRTPAGFQQKFHRRRRRLSFSKSFDVGTNPSHQPRSSSHSTTYFCPRPCSVYASWVLFAEEIARPEAVAPNSVTQV
jgi:DNA-binding transcriptional LysR family regulator